MTIKVKNKKTTCVAHTNKNPGPQFVLHSMLIRDANYYTQHLPNTEPIPGLRVFPLSSIYWLVN